MKGYKGFKKNLTGRDKQYAENTIFEEESAEIGESGMHFCANPFDVWAFYPPCGKNGELNAFAEVEALEKVQTNDNMKFCTSKLKVGKKLTFINFIRAGIKTLLNNTKNHIKVNTSRNWFTINVDNHSIATNRGIESIAMNTGEYSAAVNSSYYSIAANTGWQSVAQNTCDYSVATNTGCRSVAVSEGWRSTATNSGEYSIAMNVSDNSIAMNTGNNSVATNAGNSSIATNIGTHSIAMVEGKNSVAFTTGYDSKVKGTRGSWLICAECNVDNDILCIKMTQVDGEKIRENVLYTVKNGEFVEVE